MQVDAHLLRLYQTQNWVIKIYLEILWHQISVCALFGIYGSHDSKILYQDLIEIKFKSYHNQNLHLLQFFF